nr:hypothetical protein GCM10020185_18470 [Pseudomonas brassicacearum subsp. brassicacearum]
MSARPCAKKLKAVAEIRGPEVVSQDISSDGTRKWVVRVASGSCVETVYIPQGKRGTLCVSSQAGCALDCSFCSTGKQGFNSNLTAAEVIGQVWIANKSFGSVPATVDRAITNVVMMGMGEPLLNFDNVVSAMHLMMDDLGYGISKRRVTLSTSGVVPMIDELAKHIDVSLALSLHAPNDALRNQLVPINKKYPLKMLLESCQRYMSSLGEKARADHRVHAAQGCERQGRTRGRDDRAAQEHPVQDQPDSVQPVPAFRLRASEQQRDSSLPGSASPRWLQRHRAHHPRRRHRRRLWPIGRTGAGSHPSQ